MRRILPAVAAIALFSSGNAALGDVWVVAKDGLPGHVASLQAAVDAAADGDVILVHGGSYGPFTITAKALTVHAEEGAVVAVAAKTGSSRVTGLAADQGVVLRGLAIRALVVEDCAGPVWIEDCAVTASPTLVAPALTVRGSAQVAVLHSTIRGRDGGDAVSQAATAGARLEDSSVVIDHTVVVGGKGSGPSLLGGAGPQDGAPGLVVLGSQLQLAAPILFGGAGGDAGATPSCHDGASGGAAIEMSGAATFVRVTSPKLFGGAAGQADPACATSVPGVTGPVAKISGGADFFPLPTFARNVRASSPVRENRDLTVQLDGAPGELAVLYLSLAQHHVTVDLHYGTLLLDFPIVVVPLLPLPAGGTISFTGKAPLLPPGLAAQQGFLQAGFCKGSSCILGPGSAILLLDS